MFPWLHLWIIPCTRPPWQCFNQITQDITNLGKLSVQHWTNAKTEVVDWACNCGCVSVCYCYRFSLTLYQVSVLLLLLHLDHIPAIFHVIDLIPLKLPFQLKPPSNSPATPFPPHSLINRQFSCTEKSAWIEILGIISRRGKKERKIWRGNLGK